MTHEEALAEIARLKKVLRDIEREADVIGDSPYGDTYVQNLSNIWTMARLA